MKPRLARAWLLFGLSLSACGGGDGGSPGPTPTPAPAPTPGPTPSPTPAPAATARVIGISAASGRLDFLVTTSRTSDVFGNGFTDRGGLYYPGYANAMAGYKAFGPGRSETADYSGEVKRAEVVDTETGLRMILKAPAGVKVVTPVTAYLFADGSTQARLKTQLGITGSLFGMVADPDLATYDALAERASSDAARAADGARMLAAQVRALAIEAGFYASAIRADPFSPARTAILGLGIYLEVDQTTSRCLRDAPGQFVFTNASMSSLYQCYWQDVPNLAIDPRITSAVAHLIDAYAAAVPVRIETAEDQARWTLGIRGYLMPMIAHLASNPADAALQSAALAVTSATILTETSRYADHYRAPAAGLYFASPDFVTLPAGTTLAVDASALTGNDAQLSNTSPAFGPSTASIEAVAVPAANAGEVTASLAAGKVNVTVPGSFKGVTYFDCTVRAPDGSSQAARVYVRSI